jgi:cell division protein ZapA (FtsZ GTPase activity inhibitor)
MSANEKNTVTLDLLGIRLSIKTVQKPSEVERVAAFLKSRLDELQSHASSPDSLRIALLAGLDLARELIETRGELESLRDETTDRTLALVERLEAETEAGLDDEDQASESGNHKAPVVL